MNVHIWVTIYGYPYMGNHIRYLPWNWPNHCSSTCIGHRGSFHTIRPPNIHIFLGAFDCVMMHSPLPSFCFFLFLFLFFTVLVSSNNFGITSFCPLVCEQWTNKEYIWVTRFLLHHCLTESLFRFFVWDFSSLFVINWRCGTLLVLDVRWDDLMYFFVVAIICFLHQASPIDNNLVILTVWRQIDLVDSVHLVTSFLFTFL